MGAASSRCSDHPWSVLDPSLPFLSFLSWGEPTLHYCHKQPCVLTPRQQREKTMERIATIFTLQRPDGGRRNFSEEYMMGTRRPVWRVQCEPVAEQAYSAMGSSTQKTLTDRLSWMFPSAEAALYSVTASIANGRYFLGQRNERRTSLDFVALANWWDRAFYHISENAGR